jgi:hypothetical protein
MRDDRPSRVLVVDDDVRDGVRMSIAARSSPAGAIGQ